MSAQNSQHSNTKKSDVPLDSLLLDPAETSSCDKVQSDQAKQAKTLSSTDAHAKAALSTFVTMERVTWVVSVVICLGSGYFINKIKWVSLVWGAFIAVANLFFWKQLYNRFLQKLSNSAKENARSGLYFWLFVGQVKLLVWGGVVFVLLRYANLNVFFFLLGLSVLPLSFFVGAGYQAYKTLFRKNDSHKEKR